MNIKKITILGLSVFFLSAFSFSGDPNTKEWNGYKSWYKVTEKPNTGDPTGFLEKRHGAKKAYRVVYINQIGEATNKGEKPYPYLEGTVVVKESYKNKKAYDASKKPELTTMIKLAKGTAPSTGDWEFVMGAKGKKRGSGQTKWGKFCGDCHINAAASDYVFMNAAFFKAEKEANK